MSCNVGVAANDNRLASMTAAIGDAELLEESHTATALESFATDRHGAIYANAPTMENTAAIEPDDITVRNATESPLLRLPAELRLRIWEFAVGGHIVGTHVLDELGEHLDEFDHLRLCLIPHNDNLDERIINGAKSSRESVTKVFARGIAQGICRQIRAESLNLHFMANIFHADAPCDFEILAQRLQSHQLQAIRQISMNKLYLDDVLYQPVIVRFLPNVKRIFYSGDVSNYEVGKLLQDLGLDIEARWVEVIAMDVLDRGKKLQDAQVLMR